MASKHSGGTTTSRTEAARARIAASRKASEGADPVVVARGDNLAFIRGTTVRGFTSDPTYMRNARDAEWIRHHSPAAVEALRADLDAALRVVEAVQAWSKLPDFVPSPADESLSAALAAFEDGGKDA
mgnify:CR=1 FL=1